MLENQDVGKWSECDFCEMVRFIQEQNKPGEIEIDNTEGPEKRIVRFRNGKAVYARVSIFGDEVIFAKFE